MNEVHQNLPSSLGLDNSIGIQAELELELANPMGSGTPRANLEDWRSFNEILDIPLTLSAREHSRLDPNAKAGISAVSVRRLCREIGATPSGRRGVFFVKEVAPWDKQTRLGDLAGLDRTALASEAGATPIPPRDRQLNLPLPEGAFSMESNLASHLPEEGESNYTPPPVEPGISQLDREAQFWAEMANAGVENPTDTLERAF